MTTTGGTPKPHITTWIEAGCAIALVLITGTYTYYTAGQLHKMKRSVEAAETAAKAADRSLQLTQLEERAWVGPSKIFVKFAHVPKPGERYPFVGEFLEARIQFTNTGRTPALNVQEGDSGVIAPMDVLP